MQSGDKRQWEGPLDSEGDVRMDRSAFADEEVEGGEAPWQQVDRKRGKGRARGPAETPTPSASSAAGQPSMGVMGPLAATAQGVRHALGGHGVRDSQGVGRSDRHSISYRAANGRRRDARAAIGAEYAEGGGGGGARNSSSRRCDGRPVRERGVRGPEGGGGAGSPTGARRATPERLHGAGERGRRAPDRIGGYQLMGGDLRPT